MTPPENAFDAGMLIAQRLDIHGVPYAIGGALAYGQYGIPRATNDVDVNVFVSPDGLAEVLAALRDVGCDVDAVAAVAAATDQGMFVARLAGFRIDVFTPSIDFSWEAQRTRVRHLIDGREVWFLSAEALCVFKLLFFRSKDVADLERLIAVYGHALDAAYVRARMVEMMGPDDPRIAMWDGLWADHRPK